MISVVNKIAKELFESGKHPQSRKFTREFSK